MDHLRSLVASLPFQPVRTARGDIKRNTVWLTDFNCKCKYKFSGSKPWAPIPFPDWLRKLAARIRRILEEAAPGDFGRKPGLYRPDACHCNRYDDGSQHLTWHSDDEGLFNKNNNNATIVSLSFGAMRRFGINAKFVPDEHAAFININEGDILVMSGQMQRHYAHAVPISACIAPRFNITFRFIANHTSDCGKGAKACYDGRFIPDNGEHFDPTI